MAEYIDREALLKKAWDADTRIGYVQVVDVGDILDMPAADVVPVVHGMWMPSESDFDDDDDALFESEEWCDWQCSVCHDDICYDDPMNADFLPKFCPNCGAKMDKKEATYD